jgi:hypothetical protein
MLDFDHTTLEPLQICHQQGQNKGVWSAVKAASGKDGALKSSRFTTICDQ